MRTAEADALNVFIPLLQQVRVYAWPRYVTWP